MKKFTAPFLLAILLLLASCSGSDVYRGKWKATDSDGAKFEINFEPKSLTMAQENGKAETLEYTQNAVSVENSIKTYGIQLKDGRTFLIRFPLANDATKAVILLENNEPLYTISRTDYINYKDIYKLAK